MLKRTDFPEYFQFGAATSAYQIEGHDFGGAGRCHWDDFAAAGQVAGGTAGAVACDHYHRYASDRDLLRGFDAYRFSTSWARVLPEGTGAVNQRGLDFYDRLVDAILARDLAPNLTLYHWELPSALAARGGWTNPDIAGWFADYTDVVMARIGDRIAATATLNEPWCSGWLGHFTGQHAPGMRDIAATASAMHNLLRAHGAALQSLRARGQKNLGLVLNFEAVQPDSTSPENISAATTYDAIINHWFISAITNRRYPDAALSGLGAHLPPGWEHDMQQIGQPLDWLGVNYYTRQIIKADPTADWPGLRARPGDLAKTQMGWEIYPDGLEQILTNLRDNYTGALPLYVTENGMARDDRNDAGQIDDPERIDYINQHLRALHRAIAQGVNVRGYFYWSLLDNFEWAHGYEKRFGLIHVDFSSQLRTPKASYRMFKQAFAKT